MKITFEFNNIEEAKILANTLFSGLQNRMKEIKKVAKINDLETYEKLNEELDKAFEHYAIVREAMGD